MKQCDQTLIELKLFLPIYVYFDGQTLSSVFEKFSFTSKFFKLIMQQSTFLRKNGFESSFCNIDV